MSTFLRSLGAFFTHLLGMINLSTKTLIFIIVISFVILMIALFWPAISARFRKRGKVNDTLSFEVPEIVAPKAASDFWLSGVIDHKPGDTAVIKPPKPKWEDELKLRSTNPRLFSKNWIYDKLDEHEEWAERMQHMIFTMGE